MLGLIAELIISWFLLWIFFKRGLWALGIVPTKGRVFSVVFGFLMAAACCVVYHLAFTVFANYNWRLNKEFTARTLLSGSWWTLNSVLYEELIFRGALLYILIKKVGVKAACLSSAICFGLYHWFTSGVIGNPLQMTIVFIMTGIWGAMFATAFAKTKSLYLSIGLHFGWNFISTVIFSQGPLGRQLLVGSGGQKLGAALSVTVFIFQLLAVPVITYWYLRVRSKKQKTNADTKTTTTNVALVKAGVDEPTPASFH